LEKGRSQARETRKVRPVDPAHVDAILPQLTSVQRAMVQVQRYSGMRSGELVQLRPCDLDRSGLVWVYRPESHKTEHHDYERLVAFGPKAQEALKPFLDRDPQAHCFSPRESRAEWEAGKRKQRKTKVQPSQACRKKKKPRKQPGTCYSPDTYGNAIERACVRAGVPHWFPHQLRHSVATLIRKVAGLDAAQAVLGQQSVDVTELYAELDLTKAIEIMAKHG
jgi:integrase